MEASACPDILAVCAIWLRARIRKLVQAHHMRDLMISNAGKWPLIGYCEVQVIGLSNLSSWMTAFARIPD